MNVNQIEIALSQKISASSSNFDLLAASKALQLLKTNGVFVVSSYGGLPSAASNEGKIYFIEDIETVIWSNGTDWLRLLDKTQFTQLWSWGTGTGGRLGDGTATSRCSPVREFCSATDWCQVSVGSTSSGGLKINGEIFLWGGNSEGRLGDGTTTDRCSPVREFCSATNWCKLVLGLFHAAAIKTSGELWAWGQGGRTQLGDGTATSRCSPVREFCSATDWCDIGGGRYNSAAIKTSGEIWTWGCGSNGTLGDGTTIGKCSPVREFCSATDWCQVSVGRYHTMAIKTSGQLWSWGRGTHGVVGDGAVGNRCSPVREFCSATDWCQVSGGSCFSAAIKTSGEIWTWGCGSNGNLGDGTTTSRCSPVREFCSATDWCGVSLHGSHATAIKTSGQVWSWGVNFSGQLSDGTTTSRCSPVREISSATDWCQVSQGGGGYHTAAIKVT